MNVRIFDRWCNSDKTDNYLGQLLSKTEKCDNDRGSSKQRRARARNNIAESGILATYGDQNDTSELLGRIEPIYGHPIKTDTSCFGVTSGLCIVP